MRDKRLRGRGRVHGPYRERGGWRVVVVTPAGEGDAGKEQRRSELCETEAEAQRLAVDLRAELDAKDATVVEAIDEYLAAKQSPDATRPLKPQSAKTLGFRLRALFAAEYDAMVGDLTPRRCQAAYDALRAKPRQRADTHRNTLAAGKAFLGWAMTRGYAARNPMADVAGVGQRSVGKEQLRQDESRKLLGLAVELAKAGDLGALATATVLLAAVRAGECAAIVARDIDDGGRVLVIPRAKTAAGVRRLEIPQWLGRLLRSAAEANDGRAFVARKGQPADRYWVLYHVGRLCSLAGVPRVTSHGLRGTHATLATTGGASSAVVAASLGHTNVRITERHYTRPDATAAAQSRRAREALGRGPKRVPRSVPQRGSESRSTKRKNRSLPNDSE
jgi:integrase